MIADFMLRGRGLCGKIIVVGTSMDEKIDG